MEPPDVTGSSLTLGTAGSRRTVYLLEDNARKLAENNNAAGSPSTTNPTTSGTSNNTSAPGHHSPPSTSAGAPPSESGSAAAASAAPPSTFLMFNRISNVLGGPIDAMGQPLLDNSGSALSEKQSNDKAKDKKENGKQTAVWYEYGCV